MGLIAGILIVVLSVAHIVYGEKKQIPDLKALTDDPIMIGALRVMVTQGGLLRFAVGVVQILAATAVIVLEGVARYFPVGIIALNFLTFLGLAISLHWELHKITIPQIVFLSSFSVCNGYRCDCAFASRFWAHRALPRCGSMRSIACSDG